MRILICGGRDFDDWFFLDETMTYVMQTYHINPSDITIIEGGANGADRCGYDWALVNQTKNETYHANWDKYKKAAGPIRNQQMLDEGKPDLVVAFPTKKSRGTWDMVRRAEKAGVPVLIYKH